jgi:hypothetical protein
VLLLRGHLSAQCRHSHHFLSALDLQLRHVLVLIVFHFFVANRVCKLGGMLRHLNAGLLIEALGLVVLDHLVLSAEFMFRFEVLIMIVWAHLRCRFGGDWRDSLILTINLHSDNHL